MLRLRCDDATENCGGTQAEHRISDSAAIVMVMMPVATTMPSTVPIVMMVPVSLRGRRGEQACGDGDCNQ